MLANNANSQNGKYLSMTGERLVITTHLSDWMQFGEDRLKPSIVDDMEAQFTMLETNGFEVFNVAKAIGYDLTKAKMTKIRPESYKQIKNCDALISILQANDSELMGYDAGYAAGIGKLVLLAHSKEHTLKPAYREDIANGVLGEVLTPLDPDEIRTKINEHVLTHN